MNLHKCLRTNNLLYLLLVQFTQFLNEDEIQPIRETFMSIDMDTNGSVDQEEFHNAYLKIDFAHNLGVERKRRLS